ncbi:hypothetical protein HHK36_009101 [Tetracentron sinense]|uniref:NAC domain-containing protein n=1 Tax=Tetracentron sinense TaxID=13715 RepID=A0A834ZB59_TETSI|nr:hypothetical protein HHK36_009101 [Tetracentron sinense]
MEVESCVPPGFRFHPTEEELVGYYLKRKVNSQRIDIDVITDIDLYKIEPWDIQDKCKLGYEEKNEWYFFSHQDKKYPTGTRTNRATAAGFWKATGRDKAVISKNRVIGMRKTIVFYKGRAPNGKKTDWITHEYRLETSEHGLPQDKGWVVCRAFKKPTPIHRQGFEAWNSPYYIRDHDHLGLRSFTDTVSPMQVVERYKGTDFLQQAISSEHIQQLDSPLSDSLVRKEGFEPRGMINEDYNNERNKGAQQFIDWKNMDKFLASELSETTSCLHSNLPLIPQYYDLDDQKHGNHFPGHFSNM